MENKNELSVFRSRSSRACIGSGYQLYVGNFYRIFRASWVVAVVYAIACSLFTSFSVSGSPQLTAMSVQGVTAEAMQSFAIQGAIGLGALLLFILSAITMASYAYAAFGEHLRDGIITRPAKWYGRIDRHALLRTMKAVAWGVIICLVLGMLWSALAIGCMKVLSPITARILFMLIIIVTLVLALPLLYTMQRYILTPGTHFLGLLSPTYATSLRHIGSIFTVALMVSIGVSLLCSLTELPAIVLFLANMNSQLGVMIGDAAGMPAYMTWLNLIVFAIAGFIQAYIHLSSLFPLYYLYGKIEAEEKERKEVLK